MQYRLEDPIRFGKYRQEGLTIEQIIDRDPTYVEWLIDNVDHFSLDTEAWNYYERQLDWHYAERGWDHA